MEYKYESDFVKEVQEIYDRNRKQLIENCQNNDIVSKKQNEAELVLTYSMEEQD